MYVWEYRRRAGENWVKSGKSHESYSHPLLLSSPSVTNLSPSNHPWVSVNLCLSQSPICHLFIALSHHLPPFKCPVVIPNSLRPPFGHFLITLVCRGHLQ